MRERQEGVWSLRLRQCLPLRAPQQSQRLLAASHGSSSCLDAEHSIHEVAVHGVAACLQSILHMRLQADPLKGWPKPKPCWHMRPRLKVAQELRQRSAGRRRPVKGSASQVQRHHAAQLQLHSAALPTLACSLYARRGLVRGKEAPSRTHGLIRRPAPGRGRCRCRQPRAAGCRARATGWQERRRCPCHARPAAWGCVALG